jgi:hypothetical protein
VQLLIDEDWSKADPAGLKAAGYAGAIGYVSEDTTGKNITRAQVDALHAAGLDVGLVYEYATSAPTQGAARGLRDAAIAVQGTLDLGAAPGTCIYAAVDFNPTLTQLPAVLAYLEAFQGVCANAGYRSGAYGGYPTIQYVAQHGYTGLLWQTYAWSAGQWWPGAALRQTWNVITVAGATVDRDEAEVPDWGQWRGTDMLADERQWLKDLHDRSNWAISPATVTPEQAAAGITPASATGGVPVDGSLMANLDNLAKDGATTITLTSADLDDIATLVVRKIFATLKQLAPPAPPTT